MASGVALATFELFMKHRPFPLLLLAAAFVIAVPIAIHASDPELPFPHIRAADPQMRALVDDALDSSAIVRTLVARITSSNVVVFVACEHNPAVKASGRLNFMTSAGGLRYLVIRLKPTRRSVAIAMLAHELQHAAEIAETPSIVDDESLAREYERIGYRSHAAHGGVAFDTKAAVDIGRRVAEELTAVKPIVGRATSAHHGGAMGTPGSGAPRGPDTVRATIVD
jgi:hypothetical protein